MSSPSCGSECDYNSDASSLFGERDEEPGSSGAEDGQDSNDFSENESVDIPATYSEFEPRRDEVPNWTEGSRDSEAGLGFAQDGLRDCGKFDDNLFGSCESSLSSESKFDASGDQESFESFNQGWLPMEVEEMCYFSNGFQFFDFDEFVSCLECAMDTSPCKGTSEYANWISKNSIADDDEQSSNAPVVDFDWQHMDAEEDYIAGLVMDVDEPSTSDDGDVPESLRNSMPWTQKRSREDTYSPNLNDERSPKRFK